MPVNMKLGAKNVMRSLYRNSFFINIHTLQFNLPKNDSKYHWTQHCIRKMLFYGLTADRVKRIIRNPKRVENGVAENTIAVMVSGLNKNKQSEVWTMYQQKGFQKIIISAWRYPGVSP